MDRFLRVVAFVLGNRLRFFFGVDLFVSVAADVADRDFALFAEFADHFRHFATHVGRKRRNVQANDFAVAVRRVPEFGVDNPLLDVFQRSDVERTNQDLLRFRTSDRRDLLERHFGTVSDDFNAFDQPGIRAPGADAGQSLAKSSDRFVHSVLDVE